MHGRRIFMGSLFHEVPTRPQLRAVLGGLDHQLRAQAAMLLQTRSFMGPQVTVDPELLALARLDPSRAVRRVLPDPVEEVAP